MPHNASPLELLSHRFTDFECHATRAEDGVGLLALTTTQKWRQNESDPLCWQVELSVTFEPEDAEAPSLYHGRVTIAGEFRIHASFTEEHREALIRVTAVSMLYGACREMVANFTARSIHGMLTLPSVSFRDPEEMAETPSKSPASETALR